MRILAILVFSLLTRFALAVCPTHEFTDPDRVRLSGESVMIVVHASTMYDARDATKRGVDEATRFAKQNRIPLVYLQDGSPGHLYFMDDCAPDYWVFSEGGEVSFDVQASHLYIVGGHLEICLSRALEDILLRWAKQKKHSLTVTFFMDAIYSNGKSVEETDPFYRDFQRFMEIVSYGRPAGEHWPKLTLLETMGVIIKENQQYDYLKGILPRYDRTFSADYRAELQLNDSIWKVLRHAPGWKPPTLRFQFIDSAYNLLQ